MEGSILCLSSSFWSLLTVLGVPKFVAGSLQFLPLSSHSFLLYMCVCIYLHDLLLRTPAVRFRAHRNPVGPNFPYICKDALTNIFTFTGTGG